MANKETFRTIKNLWLFNCCTIIVILTVHLSISVATETKTETKQNVTLMETNVTSQQPIAEPLVRFRRQPPRTIVKRIVRPKRYKVKRIKRPKIKYNFAEPPPMYYSRKPVNVKKPAYDSPIIEDFSHLNMESADFDLPPSSYEAQSMDLDMYKHYEPSVEIQKPSSYKEIQKPPSYSYTAPEITFKEPSYTEIEKSPTYSYTAPEITYKETSKPSHTYSYVPSTNQPRKPHAEYGVPTEFTYSTGYDKPTDNKYIYQAPANKPVYTDIKKPAYNAHGNNGYSFKKAPAKEAHHIPATKYGVPDIHISLTGSHDYNKYSVVEQKQPHASYTPTKTDTYHFAEPPKPEPNIEITYSPSYEINIPPSYESSYSGGTYNVEHQAPPAPSYEEPSYQDHSQYHEHPVQNHPPPEQYHPPPEQYHPPAGQYNPPVEHYHTQPEQYHPPPEQYHPQAEPYRPPPEQYHPPPSNNYENPPHQNYEHAPASYQESSDTNQPASYQPAPPQHGPPAEYIPPSEELPINVNHKQPTYDYPKSSYEVPIYDPIPFDASRNQEQEVYPPQTLNNHYSQPPMDTTAHAAQHHNVPLQTQQSEETAPNNVPLAGSRPDTSLQKPQSPTNRLRRTRKRKRTKGTSITVSSTKHVLDVPELEEAFEKENRNTYSNSQEPDAHESHRVEHINKGSNGYWNPMKIQSPPVAPTAPRSTSDESRKNRRFHYKKHRNTITATTTTTTTPTPTTETPPTKIEIISIEKSRSKTFYDGPVSTPKVHNSNMFRNRSRQENPTTIKPPMKTTNEKKFPKRTTTNVFDTTIFKSPLNDRDMHRNLPRNHKPF